MILVVTVMVAVAPREVCSIPFLSLVLRFSFRGSSSLAVVVGCRRWLSSLAVVVTACWSIRMLARSFPCLLARSHACSLVPLLVPSCRKHVTRPGTHKCRHHPGHGIPAQPTKDSKFRHSSSPTCGSFSSMMASSRTLTTWSRLLRTRSFDAGSRVRSSQTSCRRQTSNNQRLCQPMRSATSSWSTPCFILPLLSRCSPFFM